MNIGEPTDAGAVQQAMHEFDGGRDAFLSEHHFGPADQYYVQLNSRFRRQSNRRRCVRPPVL
jgi:hypothetical protein